ncbi:MAG TPA: M48 family metallopeptidase [Sphingomicrobium sp.]|nr:M48 family metallopeptidase [Sphingomicrobium sp.]
MFAGRLYDGVTAHPFAVRAEFAAAAIDLCDASGWSEQVPASLLERLDTGRSDLRLGRTDRQGWRLVLPLEAEDEVAALLGKQGRYGRWIDRVGLIPGAIAAGIVAAAIVTIGYLAPQWLAPLVPESWERNVGTAIVGDFGDLKCRNAEGQRALEALVERVAPGATQGPNGIKAAALDVGIFNAAALPGGHIVLFKPAITEAEPDALAGIVAHEIAHVRRRHVTQALIRELGIGALIRLFAGDIGANAQQIVSLSYTRDNEAEADADAIAMLRRAGISPRPTAELFKRFAKEQGEGLSYNAEFLQSHPLSGGRAARFAASFDPKAQYRPALSRDQADALFNICWKPTANKT